MGRLKLPSQRNKPTPPPPVVVVPPPPVIVVPPVPTFIPTIKTNGKYFSRVDERMTLIGSSDFSLFKRFLIGDFPTFDPTLLQRVELGFNILRVWLLNDSVVSFRNIVVKQDAIHPNQDPNFYLKLTQFVDLLASNGLCVELTVFTQTQTLMPNPADQQLHLNRTADAVRGKRNVILELVNENSEHDNTVWSGLVKPQGVIISHGSNGADQSGVKPTWDYELYHSNDLSEFQRKVGHNAMEIADQTGVPCWSNENTRYPDRDNSVTHAYDSAMGAALLCAGSCYHSQNGKFSRPFEGIELDCAKAWVAGAKSIPLTAQSGQYIHRADLEGNGIIRAYEKDGQIIKIRS
jgi:hypothetical protein